MPIHVNEIIIRAIISDKAKEQQSVDSKTPESTNKDAIIAECVDQVLEILRYKNER